MTRRSGFTLLELTVALAVGGAAIAAGYATLATLVDHRRAAEQATAATQHAFALRATLSDWLAGARVDAQGSTPTFRGLDGRHEALADDEITFLTAASTPLGDGVALVRIFVARDANGQPCGLAAELSEWHGGRHSTVMLDSNVAGLDISYRSGVFTAPKWLDSWVSGTVLPGGVRISLLAAPHDSLAPLLREPIAVAIAGGR